MRKILSVFLVLTLLLSSFSSLSMAATEQVENDDALTKILYERADNPELWLEYIANASDDSLGKWLPELLKKVSQESNEANKKLVDVRYNTITRGYDWGPAIDKVVIEFNEPLDGSEISEGVFEVKSIRNFKDFSYQTFSFAEKATDHISGREVLETYVSDNNGNAQENGSYVTLELKVGPKISAGSPFNYNVATGFNEYVDTSYEISVKPGQSVITTKGEELTFLPTDENNYKEDIQVKSDAFVHNQPFSHEGIDLLYASYTPEDVEDEDASKPLVIWLHGAGEGGEDTTIPLLGNEASNLISKEYQEYLGENGAYVLVPQNKTVWMDVDGTKTYNRDVEGSNGESYYTKALMALINDFVQNNPDIDRNRIYIGGCSNGGYMTVNMVASYPEYFAAAFPICAPYLPEWITEERVDAMLEVPLWFTHALTDAVVKVAEGEGGMFDYQPTLDEAGNPILLDLNTNAIYNRLVAAGHEEVYYSRFDKVEDTSGKYFKEDGVTPHEYMGHWSWIYALNNECVETIDGEEVTLFEWLGQQRK